MTCCQEMEDAGNKLHALLSGLNSGDAVMIAYVTALQVAGVVNLL